MNTLKRLQRIHTERGQSIHIPENRRYDAGQIARFKQSHREKYDTDPSVAAIQDALGMSRRRIMRAEGWSPEVAGSGAGTDKGDKPGMSYRNPDEVWFDYVYHDQDETGRKIMEWTTGYNNRDILPKTEIARRLKMTPAAISGRITKILGKVDEGIQSGGLTEN